MPPLIRAYRPTDREQMYQLLEDLVIYVAKLNPLRRTCPLPDYAKTSLDKYLEACTAGQGQIFVAEEEKKLIGYVVGILKEQTPIQLLEFKQKRIGYIPDLYVSEKQRGKNIGSALMQTIEDYFRELHCSYVELNVVTTNQNAHELYHRLGYQDHDINMLKKL